MKKIIITIANLLIIGLVMAQAPNEFNYQAIIRNADGTVVSNESASIDISVLLNSVSGTIVFNETHNVTTTAHGLVNLKIGSVSDLSVVDWNTGIYFIKITINGVEMGTSQLLSVPYALNTKYAETSNYNNLTNKPDLTNYASKANVDNLQLQIQKLENTVFELELSNGTAKITDVDNNTYKIVKIGSQIWMTENLKTTKYNDGTDIPNLSDYNDWLNLGSSGYCWYDNEVINKEHGALYNWYAVKTNKICPTGWHVPSDEEWKILEEFIGVQQNELDVEGWRGTIEGTKLKSTSGWYFDGNGTDEYGLNILPGGERQEVNVDFKDIERTAYFWSGTNQEEYLSATFRCFDSFKGSIFRATRLYEKGMSIRCVKD